MARAERRRAGGRTLLRLCFTAIVCVCVCVCVHSRLLSSNWLTTPLVQQRERRRGRGLLTLGLATSELRLCQSVIQQSSLVGVYGLALHLSSVV